MTLPNERTNAIIVAREFLLDLIDPKVTPKIPREVRRRAISCLRHYPHIFELMNVKDNIESLSHSEADAIINFSTIASLAILESLVKAVIN